MTDYTHSKLGDLVEMAIDNQLVDYCHVAQGTVVVSMGGRPFTFATGEARAFLGNLVQAWRRTEEHQGSVPAAVSAQTEAVRATGTHNPTPPRPAPPASESNGKAPLKDTATRQEQIVSDEDYIDAVLECAEKLNLIEGYHKDRASHRIMLKTQATTADLSYFETLEYLTGSILDELRATPA